MGHIQLERLPKSKMACSDNDRFTFEIVHVLYMCLTRNFAADFFIVPIQTLNTSKITTFFLKTQPEKY